MLFKSAYFLVILTVFSDPSFAGIGIGKGGQGGWGISLKAARERSKSFSRPFMEGASIDRFHRHQEELRILSVLEVSRDQMKSLVREYRSNRVEYESLTHLMKTLSTSASKEDLDLSKVYLQFMATWSGGFHLSPSVIERGLTTWPSAMKENISAILRLGVVATSSDVLPMTREEAFEWALNHIGLDDADAVLFSNGSFSKIPMDQSSLQDR